MKKIAVIKIGARVSYGKLDKSSNIKRGKDTSGGNGEAKAIIDILYKGGADITLFTDNLSSFYYPDFLKVKNIIKLYDNNILEKELLQSNFDSLVIVNGNYNCFGGVEESIKLDICNYYLINKFNGSIYYCLCDPALTLNKNIYSAIKGKQWGSKYNENDLNITREDIIYISQAFNTEELYKIINKGKNNVKVSKENIIHFPFEKFPCLYSTNKVVNSTKQYDLLYGGTLRGGRRCKDIVKFYFNHPDLNVELFGKIKLDKLQIINNKYFKFKYIPTIGEPVNYTEFCSKMSSSFSHIVIGDELYKKLADIPQRTYESMMAGVITLIDESLDKLHRVYGDNKILNQLYVKNGEEAEKLILKIKQSKTLFDDIIIEQNKLINFDYSLYCKKLVDILK